MQHPRHRKARDLAIGNIFRLYAHGEVLAVEPVAGGKRIKVRIALKRR
jgi:hypothetical protein